MNTLINNDDVVSDIKYDKKKYSELCKRISIIFPCYKSDESFGGSKKLIKIINKKNNHYDIIYINPNLINQMENYFENECEEIFDEYIINHYKINEYVADELQYLNKLINKKTICFDKIYNINSKVFINKINKKKFNITIENYNNLEKELLKTWTYYKTYETIRRLFTCNMIINNTLFATLVKEDNQNDIFKAFKKIKNNNKFRVDIGIQNYIIITFCKINSKFYKINDILE